MLTSDAATTAAISHNDNENGMSFTLGLNHKSRHRTNNHYFFADQFAQSRRSTTTSYDASLLIGLRG
jgi:hypothetical protein